MFIHEKTGVSVIHDILAPHIKVKKITPILDCCNSFAFDLDNKFIAKFPKGEGTLYKLKNEFNLLSFLKDRISIDIPQPQLIEGPYCFSLLEKFQGDHLDAQLYTSLNDTHKVVLAKQIATFLNELHGIPLEDVSFLNLPIYSRYENLFPKKEMILKSLDKEWGISQKQKDYIVQFTKDYFQENKPKKRVLGHFDLLSKNLLYDQKEHRIKVFDFGDSAIGYHEYEFSNSNFPIDLLGRVAQFYTANPLDFHHIFMHRFYSTLSWDVNKLNHIEKVQTHKHTLENLKRALMEVGV